MSGTDWLAERFEANRPRLRAIAYRMLGSTSDAEDAVQDAWLRLSRADVGDIENLNGWLTTVIGRVCVDLLRSRGSRREEPLAAVAPEAIDRYLTAVDPEQEVLLADSVGVALIVILDTLTPAERLAFVLHDMFAVPFNEIGPIIGRSPLASRQLASRARRRVRGATIPDADLDRQRAVVEAFLAAAREGDFATLITLLDPDVVVRADKTAVEAGATEELRGAPAVAKRFMGGGGAAGLQAAVVNGAAGAAWPPGKRRFVFDFLIEKGRIVEIEVISDADRLADLDLVYLDER